MNYAKIYRKSNKVHCRRNNVAQGKAQKQVSIISNLLAFRREYGVNQKKIGQYRNCTCDSIENGVKWIGYKRKIGWDDRRTHLDEDVFPQNDVRRRRKPHVVNAAEMSAEMRQYLDAF